MQETRIVMDMPVSVKVIDPHVTKANIEQIYDYFHHIDERFSPFRSNSEVNQMNRGEITAKTASAEMKEVLKLSAQTKKETHGFFDIVRGNTIDPSGLVKGWAIYNAAQKLAAQGFYNYYVEAGGDIQTAGVNEQHQAWRVGIRNPLQTNEIIKVVYLRGEGIATSGSYERGEHVYNPKQPSQKLTDVVSLSVIGPNIFEADRFATAAFAMGRDGLQFLEAQPGLEAYMVDQNGIAWMTSGFHTYTKAR